MDAVGLSRAHVVGRSMGGAVAQHIALLAPKRVQSLVLCASFGKLDPLGARVLANMREVLEWRHNWADHARHSVQNFVSPEFFNTQRARVAGIERLIGGEARLPACYIRQNQACLEHNTLDRLGRISCPTLILAGRLDPICSPTATRWMAERIPRAETVMFDQSSHFFLMEEPEKFRDALARWFAMHTPAETDGRHGSGAGRDARAGRVATHALLTFLLARRSPRPSLGFRSGGTHEELDAGIVPRSGDGSCGQRPRLLSASTEASPWTRQRNHHQCPGAQAWCAASSPAACPGTSTGSPPTST